MDNSVEVKSDSIVRSFLARRQQETAPIRGAHFASTHGYHYPRTFQLQLDEMDPALQALRRQTEALQAAFLERTRAGLVPSRMDRVVGREEDVKEDDLAEGEKPQPRPKLVLTPEYRVTCAKMFRARLYKRYRNQIRKRKPRLDMKSASAVCTQLAQHSDEVCNELTKPGPIQQQLRELAVHLIGLGSLIDRERLEKIVQPILAGATFKTALTSFKIAANADYGFSTPFCPFPDLWRSRPYTESWTRDPSVLPFIAAPRRRGDHTRELQNVVYQDSDTVLVQPPPPSSS